MTATDTSLDGFAELARRLQESAGLPGVRLLVDDASGDDAFALRTGCSPDPIVCIGSDLTVGPRHVLDGILAHEIAHCIRPESRRTLLYIGARYVLVAELAEAAGLLYGLYAWVTVALTCAVAVCLWLRYEQRREEYRADADAVDLLTRNALPGRDLVLAMLADCAAAEPWRARLTWPLHTHPTAAARIRRIQMH